jgi:hypothetical protein
MRRIRETIVAVKKQYYIFWERESDRECVCVCVVLVIQHAKSMRRIIICDVSGSAIFFYITW